MSETCRKQSAQHVAPLSRVNPSPVLIDWKLYRFEDEAFCTQCDWSLISSTLNAIGLKVFRLGHECKWDDFSAGNGSSALPVNTETCAALLGTTS